MMLEGILCTYLAATAQGRNWHDPEIRCGAMTSAVIGGRADARSILPDRQRLSSRPGDFHPQALPEPCMNLSIHTAPDVRPLPWHRGQWAKSLGVARRSRSNQSRAPLV